MGAVRQLKAIVNARKTNVRATATIAERLAENSSVMLQDKGDRAGERREEVELTGLKHERLFSAEQIPQHAAADGVDDANEDGRRWRQAIEQGFLHAECRIGTEPQRIHHGDESREAVDARSENHAADHGGADDLDVERVGEQRRRARVDEEAVADQSASDARHQGECEDADDVVVAFDARERAREGEGKRRAEVEEDGQIETSLEHGATVRRSGLRFVRGRLGRIGLSRRSFERHAFGRLFHLLECLRHLDAVLGRIRYDRLAT